MFRFSNLFSYINHTNTCYKISLVKRSLFLYVFLRYAKRLPLARSRGWVCVEFMQNIVDQYRRMNMVF